MTNWTLSILQKRSNTRRRQAAKSRPALSDKQDPPRSPTDLKGKHPVQHSQHHPHYANRRVRREHHGVGKVRHWTTPPRDRPASRRRLRTGPHQLLRA